MKRLVLIAGLMTAFVVAVIAVTAAPAASFAGSWSLDKAKSQGLNQRLQNAESVIWVITQDAKTLSIETKVTAGQPPAGGTGAAPGGGGGAGGGGAMGGGRGGGGGAAPGPVSYNLDGNEVTGDMTFGQAPGKETKKATMAKDGTLELSRKTSFQGPNGEVTNATTQKLSLGGDGKVLTVNQHSEGARGPQDSTLVFNKQ